MSRLLEMRLPLSFVGGSAREKGICQRYSAARLRERESQKEEVRACVSPTMYSAVTFRAHNNGPRWWNGTHGFWMGRTAHWTSCSVAQILRPTLSTSPPSSILHAIFRSVSPYHCDRTADEQLRIPIPTICATLHPTTHATRSLDQQPFASTHRYDRPESTPPPIRRLLFHRLCIPGVREQHRRTTKYVRVRLRSDSETSPKNWQWSWTFICVWNAYPILKTYPAKLNRSNIDRASIDPV